MARSRDLPVFDGIEWDGNGGILRFVPITPKNQRAASLSRVLVNLVARLTRSAGVCGSNEVRHFGLLSGGNPPFQRPLMTI